MGIVRTRTIHKCATRIVTVKRKTPTGAVIVRRIPVRSCIKVVIRTKR